MKKWALAAILVLSMTGFAFASESTPNCDGQKVSTLGGVSEDSSCESGHSFTSHDLGTVCLVGNPVEGTGAYMIQGTMCENGSLDVTSARVYYLH
jgi:hypothetical protein